MEPEPVRTEVKDIKLRDYWSTEALTLEELNNLKRCRSYCFTAWEIPTWAQIDNLAGIPIKYSIYGHEICPKSGKEHWQGYMELTGATLIKTIVNKLKVLDHKAAWLGERKGTAAQAIKYCKKDGTYTENGEPNNQGKRSDMDDICDRLKTGATKNDIIARYPNQMIRYGKGIMSMIEALQPERNFRTKVTVLYGPTGTGKTKHAWDYARTMGGPIDNVSITSGGFFIGYNNSPTVVIEEFEAKNVNRTLFLQMTDNQPLTINTKGGEKTWNCQNLILCSNYDPATWYGKKEKTFLDFGTGKSKTTPAEPDAAVQRRLFKTYKNQVFLMDVPYEEPPETKLVWKEDFFEEKAALGTMKPIINTTGTEGGVILKETKLID